jgi:hypothetical protein
MPETNDENLEVDLPINVDSNTPIYLLLATITLLRKKDLEGILFCTSIL